MEWEDKVITIGPASEDDIKMYRELVDTADVIQSRVTTYVNESR